MFKAFFTSRSTPDAAPLTFVMPVTLKEGDRLGGGGWRNSPDTGGSLRLRFALASADSVREVQELLECLPQDVMRSITGSLGKRTGKLNELMATFELTQYDRLFYLGDPIDFVGIKYDDSVDFIEVKTSRFRLTEDERKLRELVEAGRVNYVPLLVERIGIAEEA